MAARASMLMGMRSAKFRGRDMPRIRRRNIKLASEIVALQQFGVKPA